MKCREPNGDGFVAYVALRNDITERMSRSLLHIDEGCLKPRKREPALWAAGLLLAVLLCIPIVASGGSVVVTPHDQLDIEVVSYRLHALHPLAGYLPEWMGGISAGDVFMASSASVVFYLALDPLGAFVANWCFVIVVSYLCMLLCLRDLGVSSAVCVVVALLYACIPFYPVFGLTVMGVPLVLLACRHAISGRGPRVWLPPVVLYGLFSSPVLCGYALIACMLLAACALLARGRREGSLRVLSVAGALLVTYLVANAYVIAGMGGGVSHRAEVELTSSPFAWGHVLELFLRGELDDASVFYHAESLQSFVAPFSIVAALVGSAAAVGWRSAGAGVGADGAPPWLPPLRWLALLLAAAFLVAVFYCLFHTSAAVALRGGLPGLLPSFQFDRFYFLYPAIWYLCAGLAAEVLLRVASGSLPLRLVASVFVAVAVGMTLSGCLSKSDSLLSARALAGEGAAVAGKTTWDAFYAPETFREVAGIIGSGGEAGRVASIGMHPSVAVMNGFWTLDGYCTNYLLDYKHRFREVVAGELACDEGLARYFDGWGNRCYLFQHEVGRNFMAGKDSGAEIRDLRLDLDAFASMEGGYIFSAVPIDDPGAFGLFEVCTCEDPAGAYRVRVYGIDGSSAISQPKAPGARGGR